MAGRTAEVLAAAAAGGALFGRDQLAVGADGRAYYYGSSSNHSGALLPVHHHQNFVQSGGAAGGVGSHDPAGGAAVAQEAAGAVAGIGAIAGMAAQAPAPPASFAPAAAPAGYGGPAHLVLPVSIAPIAATALRQLPPAVAAAAAEAALAAPFKGAWTKEEDEILRNMVAEHGDRKWATIARRLPGRVGKQCRERWINHLHPGIKKDVWTEEEDMKLIEAHKKCGNRWSVIARYLDGRSENSVKNHWNATKRSLAAKRRLRRRNSELPLPPPGQLSLLAEYIRSLCPDAAAGAADSAEAPPASPPTAPAPVTSSPTASDEYVQVQVQVQVQEQAEGSSNPLPAGQNTAVGMYLNQAPALQAEGSSNPPPAGQSTAVGMYLNQDPALQEPASMADQLGEYGAYGGGVPDGRYSYYLPSYSYGHMNLHYRPLQMAPQQQMVGGGGGAAQAPDHFHAAPAPYSVVEGMNNYLQQQHQFVSEQMNLASNAGGQEMEFDDRESSTNHHGSCYYGDPAAAGPSSGGGNYHQEEMEVVQMASREFAAGRDQDSLTLDLTRFR